MNTWKFFNTARFDENGHLLVTVAGEESVMAEYATDSRPSHEVGLLILDTDLGYPIWSDGTNWRNFTGSNV